MIPSANHSGILPSTVVPTPADYDIPYEELELKAADGVKIKAYLLLQMRTSSRAGETLVEKEPVDSVRVGKNPVSALRRRGRPAKEINTSCSPYSLLLLDPQYYSSTRMPEMWGTGYPWPAFSTTLAVMCSCYRTGGKEYYCVPIFSNS